MTENRGTPHESKLVMVESSSGKETTVTAKVDGKTVTYPAGSRAGLSGR